MVGGLLLAVLALDIFVTVLHTASGAGPYTSVQNRLIWRVGRALNGALPGGGKVLSLAAPLMALATPVVWIALLTVGFALVYLPVIEAFPANPPLEVPRWVGALYYSGYLTSTLGLGDVTPKGTPWRIAVAVQSAVGFALFSAAITYILSIYGRHREDAGLALHIHNTFRGSDLATWGEPGERNMARALAVELASRLSEVNIAHKQFPILHYFHGPEESSIVVQAGRLLDFLAAAPESERRGAALPLRRAVEEFLEQMPFDTEGEEEGDLQARHRRLMQAHGYHEV